MKTLIFYLVGAIFLFASCQSDDLSIDEASKSDNALEKSKRIVFHKYEGEIIITPIFVPEPGDCTYPVPPDNIPLHFRQEGGGNATHIGAYSFVNTACIGELGLENFEGTLTTENGELYYGDPVIECVKDPSVGICPGEPAIFTYTITGGEGLFEGATGTITIKAKFVAAGPFKGTGWADFTYLNPSN